MTGHLKLTQLVLFILVTVICAGTVQAQRTVLTEIERLRPRELKAAGFELASTQSVSIEAVGIRHRKKKHDLRLSSAWILDARTREIVWELRDADSEDIAKDLREYRHDLKLPKGRYEVYYASFPSYRGDGSYNGVGDFIGDIMDGIFDRDFDYRDYKRAAKKFRIVVRGEGKPLYENDLRDFHEDLQKNAIFSMTELDEDRYEKTGLVLDRPMDLQIYAIGEVLKDGGYDYSWIINNETRERVWELNYRTSDHAGGAKKNRLYKGTVSLAAGSYSVFCVSDDSHHFAEWNASPPNDPYFWGLTIQAADSKMAGNAKLTDYKKSKPKNVVLQFAELGDDEFESGGFTLTRPMKVRVRAIGEGTRSDGMADYSWIVNANTGEKVWEFTYRESDHAGGHDKNRMVDKTLELDKGSYIAYAVTDGSHSFRKWNRGAPYDQEYWGLTISTLEPAGSAVKPYTEEDDESVLARIVRVGDNETERKRFTLSKESRVHVYALGEGRSGDMFDYAWIENAETGRVVWEMTYRMTDHAGGAKKNRVFNDMITLDAGEYIVYYESDGSHSFRDWNAKPPANLTNWGVTIRLSKGY